MNTLGTLYLVPVPIGNWDDITLRGLRILREVDLIACEEYREARRLLSHYGIEKPLIAVNEHTEREAIDEVLHELSAGRNVALIPDAGTPVFSDPGLPLVQAAIAAGVKIVPLPGASSLLPALVASGMRTDAFVFVGWLSPKREKRRQELSQLRSEPRTLVFMDTPYRLFPLLNDAMEILGKTRNAAIALNLSMEDEEIIHGTLGELCQRFGKRTKKREFVLIVEGSK